MARVNEVATRRRTRKRCRVAQSRSASITLLYVRRHNTGRSLLDDRLATALAKYPDRVELETMTPTDLPEHYAHFAQFAPTLVALRDGEIVAEAMGESLPQSELDTVIRCAVEWPES